VRGWGLAAGGWRLVDTELLEIEPMPNRVLSVDRGMTAAFAIVGVWALMEAWAWPLRAALFPLGAASLLLLVALLKLAVDLAGPPAAPTPSTAVQARPSSPADEHEDDETSDAEPTDVFATAPPRVWLSAITWMGAFFLLLWLLGALVAVPLFAVVYLRAVSRESFVLAGAYGLACWAFTYGLFDRLLHIPLPAGTLW
jgi:hypothetical protein